MKIGKLLAGTLAALVLAAGMTGASAAMSASDKKKAIADIQKMERETLAQLYKLQPGAKATIEKSAGYAVFSNFGVKIFVAGSGSGAGVATNKKTNQKIYMKMVEIQAGLGIGVKKFRLVWVFDNESSLSNFVNSGMELGGQMSATAKKGATGEAYTGAMSVSPGVWLYQIAGDGLAAELTAKGTKYYKDSDLN